MNKKVSIAVILIVGGIGIYYLTKKPSNKNFTSTSDEKIPELTKEIVQNSTQPKVAEVYPNFGKPLVIEQSNFANYVDTKHNEFFQPELGTFKP